LKQLILRELFTNFFFYFLIFLTIVICFGDLVINPPERKELPFTLGRMEALYERYKEARMI